MDTLPNKFNAEDIAELIDAAKNGYTDIVELLIQEKPQLLEVTDSNGKTLLMCAAKYGCDDIVTLLLKYGAKTDAINVRRRTALHYAVENNHINIVKLILKNNQVAKNLSLDDITLFMHLVQKELAHISKIMIKNALNMQLNDNEVDAFMKLIMNERIDIIKLLLKMGINVNITDSKQQTGLMYAVNFSSREMVELFIKYGAIVDVKIPSGGTPFMLACRRGSIPIAELLLSNGANIEEMLSDNRTALVLAAKMGNKPIVGFLLKNNAKIDAVDNEGKTALIYAVINNHIEVVSLLIDNGASIEIIDGEDFTALMHSANQGNMLMVQSLIEKGKNEEEVFKNSVIALISASCNNQLNIVEFLIRKNITLLNAIDLHGNTALIYAAYYGNAIIVEFLLKIGVSIDLANLGERTALMFAAQEGHIIIVDLLLEAGADIEAADANEHTALDHAVQNNHMPTAYRLLYELYYKNRALFENYKLVNDKLVFDFNQALQTNSYMKYKVIKSSFKLHANPDPECHFNFGLLPLEIVSCIKKLELQLWVQDFPDWYQFSLCRYMSNMPKTVVYQNIQPEADFPKIIDVTESEVENLSTQMSCPLTLLYDTKKKKPDDNIKDDKQCEQDTDIELNQVLRNVSNLKLN